MSLATLSDVLTPALRNGYAVGGLVTLGWEDMVAYVKAAQTLGVPVILQAGPSCRRHTPLPILGTMFRYLAESVDVPVVAHLDHGYTYEECKIALESGFTSLMYDGSRKPLQQNIDEHTDIWCRVSKLKRRINEYSLYFDSSTANTHILEYPHVIIALYIILILFHFCRSTCLPSR